VSLQERHVMSALLTRQTTALAATEIFLSAGKIKSEWPPNKRVMTRFSCRLTSGEAIATRDASAKALEPVTVSADVVWCASSSGTESIAARLRSLALILDFLITEPTPHEDQTSQPGT